MITMGKLFTALIIISALVFSGAVGFCIYFISVMMYPCPSCITVDNVITITKDRHFNNYALPGSGTQEDPFLIANRTLGTQIGMVKKMYKAIEIRGTTKFFVIRNCTVYGGDPGIYISSIADNTCIIENCSIIAIIQTSWDHLVPRGGIKIENSNGIILRNNTHIENNEYMDVPELRHKDYGFILENSENCLLENNQIFCELLLMNCQNTIFRKNNQVNGSLDIYLSLNIRIYNNTMTSLEYEAPIRILNSSIIRVYENNLNRSYYSNYAVVIKHSQVVYIDNNTISVYSIILYAEFTDTLYIINNTIFRGSNVSIQFELIKCTNVVNLDNTINEPLICDVKERYS